MKTILMFFAICVSLVGYGQTTVSTYYEEKASTNPNNPCKGATIRKCAVIERTYKLAAETAKATLYEENRLIKSVEFPGEWRKRIISVPLGVDLYDYLVEEAQEAGATVKIEMYD
ncbi:hypothetical protein [Flavobacterium sp. JP2137]|uniref:hypothetical protein n=1 Tax=Flavobacterium sp. JP2137 TaxID=3414510 RepID=UPI003D2FCD99